ncbi:MAG TPA: nuclear transport factor 2 family protein [Chthoniobacterales bacterium]|jgi:ketosteroid isomerase-like protein
MQRTLLLFVGLGLAATALRAETPAEAVRAVVDAERKFYQTGQEKGTRAAFLEFLAPDAIVFRPGPVNGRDVWSKRPETGLDLVWEPTFAAIARSGDFGYDTGPSKWRAKKGAGKFTGFGHFISIWKKQSDGTWKVALDCGIENMESDVKPPLQLVTPQPGAAGTAQSLPEAQSAFIATARLDFTKAFRQFGSEEVRVYRDGSFPTIGKKAGLQLLGPEQAGIAMELTKTDVSSSADLAYCYGHYSDTRTAPAKPGNFLQIWQTDKTGTWKLVLDWQQPLPPGK